MRLKSWFLGLVRRFRLGGFIPRFLRPFRSRSAFATLRGCFRRRRYGGAEAASATGKGGGKHRGVMLTRAQKVRRRKSHHALWFAPQMAMLEARAMLSASDGRTSQTFAFIDNALGDEAAIVASLPSTPGFHSVVLDAGQDQLSQITEALRGQSDVAAIHLYSHGFAGGLQLGGTRLDVGSLSLQASQISGWASALTPDADILLYGCDVAAGDAGALFLTDIAALTGADVAASTDPTGSPSLGGNWTLEAASGPIEAPSRA